MDAGFFVQKGGLGFFEAVESVGGGGIGGFIRVDEEGEGAVGGFYCGVGDAGLEVEDCVAEVGSMLVKQFGGGKVRFAGALVRDYGFLRI